MARSDPDHSRQGPETINAATARTRRMRPDTRKRPANDLTVLPVRDDRNPSKPEVAGTTRLPRPPPPRQCQTDHYRGHSPALTTCNPGCPKPRHSVKTRRLNRRGASQSILDGRALAAVSSAGVGASASGLSSYAPERRFSNKRVPPWLTAPRNRVLEVGQLFAR